MKSKKISEKWFWYFVPEQSHLAPIIRIKTKKKPNPQTEYYPFEYLSHKNIFNRYGIIFYKTIKNFKYIGSTPI